ncbi:MAG: 50S ribosomal protein L30 [Cellvibrionales bacterium TMED49]|nr:50S ribosomal protein L30 [Porticoccaceae bacterium]OUU39217.1 MAG: 50S ribosomal protein L30 [Cellvibrionales bacterium TMED49]
MKTVKKLKITQIKSSIGRLKNHKACLTGLGLRRVGHSVEREDNPSNRGMLNRIKYLINVEEL